MAGNEFIGQQPLNPRFAIDGTTILFDWNPNNEIGASTYTWNINVKAPKWMKVCNYKTGTIKAFKGLDSVLVELDEPIKKRSFGAATFLTMNDGIPSINKTNLFCTFGSKALNIISFGSNTAILYF